MILLPYKYVLYTEFDLSLAFISMAKIIAYQDCKIGNMDGQELFSFCQKNTSLPELFSFIFLLHKEHIFSVQENKKLSENTSKFVPMFYLITIIF